MQRVQGRRGEALPLLTPMSTFEKASISEMGGFVTKRKSRSDDGRGRSEGSRRTQFAPGNQAARGERKRKRRSLPDNAIGAFRKALYQPVYITKNAKRRKMSFIDAYFQKMMADALNAPLIDKLRFYKELLSLGIMDVQIYKIRMERWFQKEYDKIFDKLMESYAFIKQCEEAYKSAALEKILYKTAFYICCKECTCGVSERAFDEAGAMALQVFENIGEEYEDDEEDDGVDYGLADSKR